MGTRIQIFLLSVFILYVELLLVRWIGTEISIFAYLQNAVLICCFLGLGLGCTAKPKAFPLSKAFGYLAILTLCLSFESGRHLIAQIGDLLSVLHDFVVWRGMSTSSTGELILAVAVGLLGTFIFANFIWRVMVPLGAELGDLFDRDESPVLAYSINIAGSLVGAWLFVGLSVLSLPPFVWFLVLAVLAIPIVTRDKSFGIMGWLSVLALMVIPFLGSRMDTALETRWSPYQKLEVHSNHDSSRKIEIMVNNTTYQTIFDNTPDRIRADLPDYAPEGEFVGRYDVPGLLAPDAKNVLIVGAGSGNDVAGLLRTTKASITAVEIDPAIVDFGRTYHPEQPYASPRVSVRLDDARAEFMRLPPASFDLIVFGLLDSHATPSLANARLDHYVYTKEAMQNAARLLSPNGVFVIVFEPQRPYIVGRLAQTLAGATGTTPVAYRFETSPVASPGTMFVAGDVQRVGRTLQANPKLQKLLEAKRLDPSILFGAPVLLTSDNWPYLYLERPMIPTLFILLGAILTVLWIQSSREVFGGWSLQAHLRAEHIPFVAMGAGFSLFQVFGVSQGAILFGSTWFVNAIVISSMLTIILGANLLWNALGKISLTPWLLTSMAGVLVSIFFFDFSALLGLPTIQKVAVMMAVVGAPMLLTGYSFASLFDTTSNRSSALGANLFGALLGGALQLVTYYFGIKSLLLCASTAYLIAAFAVFCRCRKGHETPAIQSTVQV